MTVKDLIVYRSRGQMGGGRKGTVEDMSCEL